MDSHLSIYPTEIHEDHKLAKIGLLTATVKNIFQRAAQTRNPQLALKESFVAYYCSSPPITSEDIIEYKLEQTKDPNKLLLILKLKP